MVALIKALQLIIALSLLIFIHELGHFTWARIFGIRVEKFYLFFDVRGKALARWKWGETEFGIGWLPLGGYCKIAGMIDESMDLEHLGKEAQPWEFRAHKAWHRLLVLAGGVLNNLIFAVLCFILILGIWGQSYISNEGVGIYPSPTAEKMGFRAGDRILLLDDYHPDDFTSLQADLARRNVRKATILRGEDTLVLYIDHSMMQEILEEPMMFDIAIPFVVDSVMNANNSMLEKGDRIISIAGEPCGFLQESAPLLAAHAGSATWVEVVRGADTLCVDVQIDTAGRLGIMLMTPQIGHRTYTALEAIPAGARLAASTISGYVRDLRLLATPSTGAYKSVGSFVAIGQIMPASWDWHRFMNILGLLSIMLAVMNLLPIPGLDGGHILFVLYEMVSGRKPSEKFLYIAQLIGMFLLIMLMMLAFGNDIGRLMH